MTNVNTQTTSFTSGELSPKVRGRFDLAAYFNGVRRMENWIPQEQGPATYRNGFHYVGETKNNNKAFLYNFQFSDVQAYMLEFTNTRHDPKTGQTMSLRCLRNTALTRRRESSNANPFDIASNARTSKEILNRFYNRKVDRKKIASKVLSFK